MKISPEIREAQQEAAIRYTEARKKLQRIKNQIHDEENSILEGMFYELSKTDEPLTAAEISSKLDEAMSKHEVAGQLKLICNPFCRTQHPTHSPVQREQYRGFVQKIEKTKTKRFAEIDDKGEIIPGGKVFETKKTYNTYIKVSASVE